MCFYSKCCFILSSDIFRTVPPPSFLFLSSRHLPSNLFIRLYYPPFHAIYSNLSSSRPQHKTIRDSSAHNRFLTPDKYCNPLWSWSWLCSCESPCLINAWIWFNNYNNNNNNKLARQLRANRYSDDSYLIYNCWKSTVRAANSYTPNGWLRRDAVAYIAHRFLTATQLCVLHSFRNGTGALSSAARA